MNASDTGDPRGEVRTAWHAKEVVRQLLCVASDMAGSPGEVWRIDLGYGPEPLFSRVAGSFEQLMIGAGRLDEMAADGVEGWLPVDDFLDSMRPLGVDDEQLANWRGSSRSRLSSTGEAVAVS